MSINTITKQIVKAHPELIFTTLQWRQIRLIILTVSRICLKIRIHIYTSINRNLTNKILSDLKNFKGMKQHDYASISIYSLYFINSSNAIKFYALPKIHKTGCPFSLIVSSIRTPLHNLIKGSATISLFTTLSFSKKLLFFIFFSSCS